MTDDSEHPPVGAKTMPSPPPAPDWVAPVLRNIQSMLNEHRQQIADMLADTTDILAKMLDDREAKIIKWVNGRIEDAGLDMTLRDPVDGHESNGGP